jgi:diguanylate cyclase (GGDEF)-like protein
MGGDEFAAFLVETDEETGSAFLARLHDAVDELIASGEVPPMVTLSPGLAHYPTEGATVDALFRLADERLYEAKRAKQA